jgi:predicted XRE-type DNA-binding protein
VSLLPLRGEAEKRVSPVRGLSGERGFEFKSLCVPMAMASSKPLLASLDAKEIEILGDSIQNTIDKNNEVEDEEINGGYEDDDDEGDNDDDHERYDKATISCNAMRKKITMFLATKEMTQTNFCSEMGISPGCLTRFMKLKGADNGYQNSTYWGALKFFGQRKKKEKAQLAAQKKALKEQQKGTKVAGKKRSHTEMESTTTTSAATPLDYVPDALFTHSIPLQPATPADRKTISSRGEAIKALADTVTLTSDAVYDDCDEVRRKIGIITQSNLMSSAQFSGIIGVTPATVSKFMSKKGADIGAGSTVYPNAYYFFEKLRIAKKQDKIAARKRHEREHPRGLPLQEPPKRMWVFIGNP